MMRETTARLPHTLVALAALTALLACGDDDGSGPRRGGPPTALEIVSGDDQDGTVGTELDDPLVVRVLDADGDPVRGQTVEFRVSAGGGSLDEASVETDSDGTAEVRWTLGTVAGSEQNVEASVDDGAQPLAVSFSAIALPGAVVTLQVAGGAGQTGVLGQQLAESLAVRAVDSHGNGVPGVPIAWQASAAGDAVLPGSAATGADGAVRAAFRLGARVDVAHAAIASAQGAPDITILVGAALPAGTVMQRVSGDDQRALPGDQLPESLAVRVVLPGGAGVVGLAVGWQAVAGGGSLSPATVVTDVTGLARAAWTIGPSPGPNGATASAAGVAPVSFGAIAVAPADRRLVKVSGDRQTGGEGSTLPRPLVVRVVDGPDRPVAGETVTWTVGAGCGSVAPATGTTDAAGFAQTRWTLGSLSTPCLGGITASIRTGATVTFTAVVVP
jgi:hypothetical protein